MLENGVFELGGILLKVTNMISKFGKKKWCHISATSKWLPHLQEMNMNVNQEVAVL